MFLHLISTPFATFYKRKGRIFRFPKEKRSLLENTCQISFLDIHYSPSLRIVIHSSLLCLSVICWLHVCSREWIFNLLISLFFFRALCWVFYYSFLKFLIKIILFTLKKIVVLTFDLYSFLDLPLSVTVEFSGFPWWGEAFWELVLV